MRQSKDKKDFGKLILPLLVVFEKQTKHRTDDELNQIVQVLKKTKLFVELLLMAQTFEIKELLKHAEVIHLDMGDIFNQHQTEIDNLYIIAQGQMWTMNTDHKTITEKIAPIHSLNQYPTWWFLTDPERLRQQYYLLLDQVIKRQGQIKLSDLTSLLRNQKQCYKDVQQEKRNSISVPHNKWNRIRNSFLVDKIHPEIMTQNSEKKVYSPGDVFASRFQGHNYDDINISKQINLMFPKMDCILIKIPQISLTMFFDKILQRLRRQEHDYFRSLSIFSELSKSDVQTLHSSARIIEYRRCSIIFKQGDDIDEFYVVRQGEVEISSNCPLSIVSEGQVIGQVEMILNHSKRQYTATVKSHQCVLYQFSKANFFKLIHAKTKEEQIIVCQSQEKYAKKINQFRNGKQKEAYLVNHSFVKEKKIIHDEFQPLLRTYCGQSSPFASRSFSPLKQKQSITKKQGQILFIKKTKISPNHIRSKSPQEIQYYRDSNNPREIIKSLQIRLNNPLVNDVKRQNQRLDEIRTVQGYYNEISKTQPLNHEIMPKKNKTLNLENCANCVNDPPQNIRRTIKYLRSLTGNYETEMNTSMITQLDDYNEIYPLRNSKIIEKMNSETIEIMLLHEGFDSHLFQQSFQGKQYL